MHAFPPVMELGGHPLNHCLMVHDAVRIALNYTVNSHIQDEGLLQILDAGHPASFDVLRAALKPRNSF
jgi:hypothetical protein